MPTDAPASSLIDALDRLPLPEPTREAIAAWLGDPTYIDTRAELEHTVARALGVAGAGGEEVSDTEDQKIALAELEDAFVGPLPIGTGGRRGPCGPGPNRVNAAVMRETARGLAAAMRESDETPKVAVVYDTRTTSRTFALVVAAALTAEQIAVTLIDGPRPTPQLSFLVRRLGCGAGIVISASHNPPTDNGIKIYGPDGAQVLGELDRRLMEGIVAAGKDPGSLPPINLEAATAGEVPAAVERIDPNAEPERADAPYHEYVLAQGVSPGSLADSGLRVAFTPLHGVGDSSVIPVLRERGLEPIVVEAQLPDEGRFETVKSANPESVAAFAVGLELARSEAVDLLLATDPDADRLGAMVRDASGEYRFIDGNRLGVLMLDHVLRGLTALGSEELRQGWVLTTVVSSPLIAKLARARSVEVVDDLLVGFKHHAGAQADAERRGEDRSMVFACEESHGYLRGNEIRDKDGAIAALLLCECAAVAKREGKDLFARLDDIWRDHGYHREQTGNLYAQGSSGRRAIAAVMDRLRSAPPTSFGGLEVVAADDLLTPRGTGWRTRDLNGNVLVYELSGEGRGCRLVFRPSGTEPKIKVYALAHGRAGLDDAGEAASEREAVDALVARVLADAERFASGVMAALLDPQ
ncbi:Phosphoglucomutase [Enhygromyxa salina]|uniref:Phosphoglucomutase n=1 Tax=Enhygromyxa salina TaxID=215803 RepID=A0A2S9YE42_9BACT|nr:phospho-sugar mutase [Enhygromyxa salina]PRQ03384.1 Phosphoglucomutase [Enhygromyxa salina]